MGYHKRTIQKGILGESSKIQEELDELKDAEEQEAKIMIYCELADIFGALEAYASKYGLTMNDLEKMSELTKAAFQDGSRR